MNYPNICNKKRFRLFFEAFLIFVAITSIGKLTGQEASFQHSAYDLAYHIEATKGIPYEFTMAVYRLESANGTSDVATNYNNYFGIRQRNINPDGSEYYTYRYYESMAHCFIFWAGMIADRVYSECMEQELRLLVACVAERYSEDYHWADKILELAHQIKDESR